VTSTSSRVQQLLFRPRNSRICVLWREAPYSPHPLTLAVEQRVNPKSLPQRLSPSESPRARSFLAQQQEDCSRRPVLRAWREQSKISDSMRIVLRNVLHQRLQELCIRKPHCFPLLLPSVLADVLNFIVGDSCEAVLRDRRPAQVSTRVTDELSLGDGMAHEDIPLPGILGFQSFLQLPGVLH
jgi:hypothetical protein